MIRHAAAGSPAQAGILFDVALARHPGAGRDPVLSLFASTLAGSMATRAFALKKRFSTTWRAGQDHQKKGRPGGTALALRAAPASNTGQVLRVLPILFAVLQVVRTSKNRSNGEDKIKIKIKSTPPRSSLRAREEAESNNNGRLHRVRGVQFPIPHSPFPACLR
jgi:hypothetical protein